ncbi:hypothetical protein LCGC14_2717730, partial [marine sediment metagenome]
TVAGVFTRTADADDITSQAKFNFTRRKAITGLGEITALAAQRHRDAELEATKDVWPQLENVSLGTRVRNDNLVTYPSYWVRAGEVIKVLDLVPASADLDSVTLDAIRTLFITETTYDVDRGQLSLVFDTVSSKLEAVLARSL